MPIPLPRPPSRLDNILTWAGQVQAYLKSLTPCSTPSVQANHQWNGTSHSTPSVPSSAPAAVQSDFTLYDASASHATEGGLWVGILFGNVTPNGIPLSTGPGDETTNPWPDVFTADDGSVLPNYEFQVTDSGLAWLHIQVDPTVPQVTGITIESGAAFPAYTDTDGYQGLGNWTVTGGGSAAALTLLNPGGGFGSQNYLYCGGFHYFWPI